MGVGVGVEVTMPVGMSALVGAGVTGAVVKDGIGVGVGGIGVGVGKDVGTGMGVGVKTGGVKNAGAPSATKSNFANEGVGAIVIVGENRGTRFVTEPITAGINCFTTIPVLFIFTQSGCIERGEKTNVARACVIPNEKAKDSSILR